MQVNAEHLATAESHHREAMQNMKDEYSTEVTQLHEEIKRLEPFKSRANMLNGEITKLMAELCEGSKRLGTPS